MHRIRFEYLQWVEQVLDIIEKSTNIGENIILNDIGSNVGQFWKGIKRRNLCIDYIGYDIEPIYIENALSVFPELKGRLLILDISNNSPRDSSISICSSTLEHINNYEDALINILKSTHNLVIVRTFLGKQTKRDLMNIEGSSVPHIVNQYSFKEMENLFQLYNFNVSYVLDSYTSSKPRNLGNGISRNHYLIVANKKLK